MKKTQKVCLEGLEKFSKNSRENLVKLNENSNYLDDNIKNIEKEINRMMYIRVVLKFYKFTIGPYDILFDRINHKIFFVIHSSNTTIKVVDVNDHGLYIQVFIVG